MPETPKRVAIIGGGQAGLTAYRHMINYPALKPVLFEKSSSLGGIWSPAHPFHRPRMTTNISRHTCQFSDVPWPSQPGPERKDLFQYSGDMDSFLLAYAERYLRDGDARLNTEVISVDFQKDEAQWLVKSKLKDGKEDPQSQESFDYLIVATGFFAKPSIPNITGLATRYSVIMHSALFKDPNIFKGKTVAVVGGSLSAVEIAGDLSPYAAKIHHITPRPFYVHPLYIPTSSPDASGIPPFLPWDFDSYRRSGLNGRRTELVNPTPEQNAIKHRYFASLFPNNLLPPFKFDTSRPAQVGFSELYRGGIQSGITEVHLGRLASINTDTGALVLSTDSEIPAPDYVIMCTGYDASFPFSKSALDAISFDPSDHSVPFLTHRLVLHPDLPKAGFVGVYRGSYYGVIELQARYLAAIFAGAQSWPSDAEMRKGVEYEKKVREESKKSGIQFPHGDYAGLFESYADLLGLPLAKADYIVAANYPLKVDSDVKEIRNDVEHSFALSKQGTWAAAAIFRSWAGRWQVRRVVKDASPRALNGQFLGLGTFHMRPAAALPGGPSIELGTQEYLYEEQGVFISSDGEEKLIRRKLLYQYSPALDKISVWSILSDDDEQYSSDAEEPEEWLHDISAVSLESLEPAAPEGDAHAWFSEYSALDGLYARGSGTSTSKPVYKFVFGGAEVTQFGVLYEVHRSDEKYVSESWFTRPQSRHQ